MWFQIVDAEKSPSRSCWTKVSSIRLSMMALVVALSIGVSVDASHCFEVVKAAETRLDHPGMSPRR